MLDTGLGNVTRMECNTSGEYTQCCHRDQDRVPSTRLPPPQIATLIDRSSPHTQHNTQHTHNTTSQHHKITTLNALEAARNSIELRVGLSSSYFSASSLVVHTPSGSLDLSFQTIRLPFLCAQHAGLTEFRRHMVSPRPELDVFVTSAFG